MRKEESKFATIFLISVVIILFGVLIFIGNKDGIESIRGNVVSSVIYDAFDGTSLDSGKWTETKPANAVIQVGTPTYSVVTNKGSLLYLDATSVDSSTDSKEVGLISKFKLKDNFVITIDVYPDPNDIWRDSNIQFGVNTSKFSVNASYYDGIINSDVTNKATGKNKRSIGFECSTVDPAHWLTEMDQDILAYIKGNIYIKTLNSAVSFINPRWTENDGNIGSHNCWEAYSDALSSAIFTPAVNSISLTNVEVPANTLISIGYFNQPVYVGELRIGKPNQVATDFKFCWDQKVSELKKSAFKLRINRTKDSTTGVTSIKIEKLDISVSGSSWTTINEITEEDSNLYGGGMKDETLFDGDASVFIKISKKQGSPAGSLKAFFNNFSVNEGAISATGTSLQYRKCAYSGENDITSEGHACDTSEADTGIGCTSTTDAVFGGKCYKTATTIRVYSYNDISSGFADVDGDTIVGEYNKNGIWQDCDYTANNDGTECTTLCAYSWLKGGELKPTATAFGEYELASLSGGTFECCGDDAGEYAITTGSKNSCCNNKNDCVDSQGICRDGKEDSTTLCTNGIDDDCDGLVDSSDSNCQLCVSKLNGDICGADQICPTTGQLLTASDTNYCCSVACDPATTENLCRGTTEDNKAIVTPFAKNRCSTNPLGYYCEASTTTPTTLVAVLKCQGPDLVIGTADDCGCPTGGQSCMSDGTCLTLEKCSDGTLYGKCSANKPNYCSEGTLVSKCQGPDLVIGTADDCGCPHYYELCQEDGSCLAVPYSCSQSEIGSSVSTCQTIEECSGDWITVLNPPGTRCCKGTCIAATDGCKDSSGTVIASVGACLSSGIDRYCNSDKQLVEDCVSCGCLSGKLCDSTTKKCVDASTMCNGCIHPLEATRCIAAGTRLFHMNDVYCELTTKSWTTQKATGVSCSNDYECKSNVCIDSKCTSFEEESAIFAALKSLVCGLIPIQKPDFCTA